MDWFEFIASLVNSLAWPGAAVALVLILRKPLSGIIPLLQRLKYKHLELEFGKRVEEVSEKLVATIPRPTLRYVPSPSESRAIQLAEVSPRAAVMDAWREVERAVIGAAERNDLSTGKERGKVTPLRAIRSLEQAELVERDKARLLSDVRMLRNQAAHAPEFALSKDSAIEYVSAAHQLASYLDGL
jgi:hypothetical protein